MSILEPTDDPNVFLNTRTNRKVRVGSQQYNKIIAEEQQKNEEKEEEISDKKIQKKTKKILTSIVKDNKKKLQRSHDPETELKRMLYDKLCLVDKKSKKKVRYESSSSESSDSDSSD